ncbi:MAG: metallophosphoesterase family protein [Candidatus Fimenecus sp.]
MRILVFSDSHRYGSISMKKAIEQQPDAEAVIFLGDGADDFENCKHYIKDKRIYTVCGNNDFYCDYPKNQVITEGGINIYITHGHYEYVKSTLGRLLSAAKDNGCALALYGHTHTQKTDYADGIHLFCPGALMNYEYGVVDITDKGLICIGMKVR